MRRFTWNRNRKQQIKVERTAVTPYMTVLIRRILMNAFTDELLSISVDVSYFLIIR